MLTTLKSYLGTTKSDIDSIVSPLTNIVARLDEFLAKGKADNDADRDAINQASERISARSKEITRAADTRSNINGILGGLL